MDSYSLARLMSGDKMIKTRFRGIYPLDMIPDNLPAKSLIVVNQDKSMEAGSHWIVLHYKSRDIVEYFDSVGKQPKKYIENLLLSNMKSYMYNNKRLQAHDSYTCGLFCLYYSFYSCRLLSFSKILEGFTDNLDKNKKIVHDFFLVNFLSNVH